MRFTFVGIKLVFTNMNALPPSVGFEPMSIVNGAIKIDYDRQTPLN
jgi:hypothetical protein